MSETVNVNINISSDKSDNSSIQVKKSRIIRCIVLDRSGSMNLILSDTIGGVNAFRSRIISEEKEGNLEPSLLTIKLFDGNSINDICTAVDINHSPELTKENYIPRASTPLYDAIGIAISDLKKFCASNPDYMVQLIIVTDGHENCSREHTSESIRKMISECEEQDWVVTYLGANQDAVFEGSKFGSAARRSASFTPRSISKVMEDIALKSSNYRSTGMASAMSFSENDRDKYLDDEVNSWSFKEQTRFTGETK